ncbi:MAG: CpXC domain-containing protein [Elusimicrobiota bacterium]
MSVIVPKDVVCPECQYPNQTEVWSSISVHEDPELRDILLGGELNMTQCESCKEFFYAESFLLYHDKTAELFAFVYPFDHASEKEKWIAKTKEDFSKLRFPISEDENNEEAITLDYAPLTFFGLDDLITTVEWDDEMLLQSEIAKTICDQNKKTYRFLSPFHARTYGLPIVLPFDETLPGSDRDKILLGLEWIKKENDQLEIYVSAYERIQSQPELIIPLK